MSDELTLWDCWLAMLLLMIKALGSKNLRTGPAADLSACVQVPEGRRGYETWRYKGGYWEARETGNWAGIREIYGDGPKGFKAPELLY